MVPHRIPLAFFVWPGCSYIHVLSRPRRVRRASLTRFPDLERSVLRSVATSLWQTALECRRSDNIPPWRPSPFWRQRRRADFRRLPDFPTRTNLKPQKPKAKKVEERDLGGRGILDMARRLAMSFQTPASQRRSYSSSGRAVRTSMCSLDDGGPEA